MIRCPFNNFSKCDGSCPWSQPNFTDCGLRADLAEVNGKTSGILARLRSADDRLKELGDILAMTHDAVDALRPRVEGENGVKPRTRIMDERTYIKRRRDGKLALYLSVDDTEALRKLAGNRGVGFEAHTRPPPAVYVHAGGTYKLGVKTSGRSEIFASAATDVIDAAFGIHEAVFMASRVEGDSLVLTPDGEVKD